MFEVKWENRVQKLTLKLALWASKERVEIMSEMQRYSNFKNPGHVVRVYGGFVYASNFIANRRIGVSVRKEDKFAEANSGISLHYRTVLLLQLYSSIKMAEEEQV